MLKDHAIVEREGFQVPLIGVPPESVLQQCAVCRKKKPLREIELSDIGQPICKKCRTTSKPETISAGQPVAGVA